MVLYGAVLHHVALHCAVYGTTSAADGTTVLQRSRIGGACLGYTGTYNMHNYVIFHAITGCWRMTSYGIGNAVSHHAGGSVSKAPGAIPLL